MNSVYRLMVAAAVSVAAIVSASAETPAGGAAEAPKGAQPPIPTLHCEFKAMSACSPTAIARRMKSPASRSR